MKLTTYLTTKASTNLKRKIKLTLPDAVKRILHDTGVLKNYIPSPGNVKPGDFHRTTPFSYDWGFDRGGALDRYYIEKFLQDNSQFVTGSILEIGDNDYTLRFGKGINESHILHVDSSNEKATYVGDISHAPHIPSEEFDCIILAQTLHLIYDSRGALQTCHRILKRGGVLLMTVPGISHIDHGPWRDYWLWSFTDKSIRRLLDESFPSGEVTIKTYGNVYAASAFLYGMGLPEFDKSKLDYHDKSYQLIIGAKAQKL